MAKERYVRKDRFGKEYFDIQAYEDDEQMNELARMGRKNKEKKTNIVSKLVNLFSRTR